MSALKSLGLEPHLGASRAHNLSLPYNLDAHDDEPRPGASLAHNLSPAHDDDDDDEVDDDETFTTPNDPF